MNIKRLTANRKYVSTIVGVIIVITVVGIYLIRSLLPFITGNFMKKHDPWNVLTTAEIVLTLLFLSFIPVVFYLLAQGRRTINSERFPLTSSKVKRDTPLMKGHQEAIRFQMMTFIAILLIVLALIGWMFTHFAVQSLIGK